MSTSYSPCKRSAAAPSVGARILLAEDDLEMRTLLDAVLRCAGYRVTALDSGSELLSAFERSLFLPGQEPFAIVTDVRMAGGVSGLDVLAEIRRRGSRTPVILISGFADEDLRHAATRWGAASVLAKPFELGLLLEALSSVGEAD